MVSRRANAVLNENPELFAFLPSINFGYLYYSTPSNSTGGILIIALLTGSFIYNYSKGSPDEIGTGIFWTYIVSYTVWIFSYILSIRDLLVKRQSLDAIMAILLFISIGFLFVGVSHIALKLLTKGYDQEF